MLTPSLFKVIRSMSSPKLFVGVLSWSTDEMSLREAFSQYREVVEGGNFGGAGDRNYPIDGNFNGGGGFGRADNYPREGDAFGGNYNYPAEVEAMMAVALTSTLVVKLVFLLDIFVELHIC
ncbi:unnamed protein product [Fraxinus pennsylvanica]|uniref:Uncharacterized protein n=1 Tax=Fraxinus pennsylvanica TaxID=56036 RepID=A0AAD2DIL8_9LAMI|nr:unnamed protein product [Fraxinus pennsylvanica]